MCMDAMQYQRTTCPASSPDNQSGDLSPTSHLRVGELLKVDSPVHSQRLRVTQMLGEGSSKGH